MEHHTPPIDHDNRRRLLALFQVTVALIFAVLLIGFWHFQVGQHARFLEMAENNHQRRIALRAPRGVVFDRDGEVLVENRYSLNISLVREEVEDLDRSIRLLAEVTGIDEAAVRGVVERHRRDPVYRPIVIIQDASLAQVASVTARKLELPGVVVEQIPARYYPTATLAAHSFGYVGEITDAQLATPTGVGLASGDIVGQSGIEQAYNGRLMGTDGTRHVVVNSVGREIETLGEIAPAEGQGLQLTIDYDLQKAAEDAFRLQAFEGAAVVLDPQTGEVLSLVSLPAYDPNAFATGIDGATWTALNTDGLKPLQNRALQGRYSPGSTFKIAMAVAALEEGVVTPDFTVTCGGGASFYGRFYKCWKKHGTVKMDQAIEQSCNTYFYTLGEKLDVDQIHKWSTALGLGEMSGIDLPHEVRGLIPSRAWKRERHAEPWYPGETISVAIGQGQVSVTPISLAVMMATTANGGRRVVPRLLKAFDDGTGWQPVPPPSTASLVRLRPETLETVTRGLWMVVNQAGTGGRGRIDGRDVIGKTGTAQVISLEGKEAAGDTDKDLRDHGWFVFAAPRDNPQIAGVVFAEHSEHGYLAAPIARHVMETFFAKREGRPLPMLPLPARPPAVPARVLPVTAAANGGGNE